MVATGNITAAAINHDDALFCSLVFLLMIEWRNVHSWSVTSEPRNFKFGTKTYHSKSHPENKKRSLKGAWSGSTDPFKIFTPHVKSPQQLTVETSNFVHGSDIESLSLSLVMSECSLSGRGQGHVSNFYILHLGIRKFRHSKSSLYWWYTQLDRGRFAYDTYKTMKATQARHGWVHMFITHRSTLTLQPWRTDGRRTLSPTTTLQLHNFDLFRTCRTSSFSTVAWQSARF